MWIRDPRFGVRFDKLVHIAQDATFHSPLPPSAEVIGTARVVSIFDRGEGRGAELVIERIIRNRWHDVKLCTSRQTLLLRGDGGFGGAPAARASDRAPNRAPDRTVSLPLSSRAALIYRLSGDWNPLHIDPDFAHSAGFARPIMHGLGVYGSVAIAIARALDVDPATLSALSCRFVGIVIPGDTLEIDLWPEGDTVRFTASVAGRKVLDQGRGTFAIQSDKVEAS